MYKKYVITLGVLLSLCSTLGHAQEPVVANKDHAKMLSSSDPKLAANKKLVYDFWREVFEGGHLDLAPKYLAENYIQHNPNVATGRKAFVDFFSKFKQPKAIAERVESPLVSIVAEGDMVILTFSREYTDPKDATRKYTTSWFDQFRIENGKIAEHWDPATRQ
ncbi:MAG TPA: nuclear transport factor 2 family protein [Cellvibrio sp.]